MEWTGTFQVFSGPATRKNASILGLKFFPLIFYLDFIKYKCVCLPVKLGFSWTLYFSVILEARARAEPNKLPVNFCVCVLFLFLFWPVWETTSQAFTNPLARSGLAWPGLVWLNKTRRRERNKTK